MKFKSKLGRIALEELTEDQAPEAGEGEGSGATDGAAAAAADTGAAAAAATPEAGAAPDAGAAGGEGGAGDAGGEAGAADAGAAADTGAAADAGAAAADTGAAADAGAGDAGAGDTGTPEGGEGAPAVDPAAAADSADAQQAAAAAQQAEGTGEPTEAVGDAADVGGAEAEEVEGEMEAVDATADQAADVQEDVGKLEAATESLEGCVAILDAAAQRGGLDIFGASLLRNNVNTVTKSLKVKNLMLPALEDMESPSAKIDGANSAKEQIVAFIQRILKAIKDAFDRLAGWVVETYKRLTNAFVALERRAQKLEERVRNSKMKEGSIESRGLASKMVVGGAPVKDVARQLQDIAKTAEKLNDPKSYRKYLEVLGTCEDLVKNPEKFEELSGKISGELASFAGDLAGGAAGNSTQGVESREGTQAFTVALFDNQTLVTYLPNSIAGINVMSSTVVPGQKVEASSVPALSSKDADKICKAVAAIAKSLRESGEANRGGVKEVNSEIKKHKDTIFALTQSRAGDNEGSAAEAYRKVMLLINKILMMTPKMPIHAINRALPRNLGYALDYVAASLAGSATPMEQEAGAAAPALGAPAAAAA